MTPSRRLTRLTTLAYTVGVCFSLAAETPMEIAISQDSTSGARPVEPDLFSLSIEQDRWLDWQLTGVPPRIRVGGKSQDVTYIDPNTQWASVSFAKPTPSMPYPEALVMRVGTRFYSSARFLPEKTRVVHGLNFASTDDMRGFFHLASIVNAFTSAEIRKAGIVLDAIEIGNEPDAYGTTSTLRNSSYDSSEYVTEWQTWAGNVLPIEQVYPEFKLKLWGGSLSRSSHDLTGWSPQALLDQGLLNSTAGERISTISQHRYDSKPCESVLRELQELPSKSSVRNSLDAFKFDIYISRQHDLEHWFMILVRAPSDTIRTLSKGAVGISDTAAAALWTLDYALYASTLGVSRVFFHQGIGYRSNMVQPIALAHSPDDGSRLPVALPPHVNAPYYAAIIGAEAIGSHGSTRIAEMPVDDSRIAGYAFYEGDTLARVLLINSQPYFAPTGEGIFQTRPAIRVTLSTESSEFRIKRLSIPFTDSTSGMRWGNVTYESDDGRPSGVEHFEHVKAKDGFDISATEVVLAFL
ncbi:hypothetical protein EST38_g7719 [Candolleomyces aberdarensis]|uniref:Beta-glucuronidase C-terminal domain-containing protein n=1 Tax=Candolleomyces aberdarensis TaxID=2316362 RepID=A0A4V1Q3C8_9AGAR|nr:hypothetical protein EST38_g7719 [Candolleomyces aberdarensis]